MKMKRFPKLRYPNHPDAEGILDGEVVVTEKADGANCRISWSGGNLRIGTRNHEYDADDENLPKAFRHAVEYVRDEGNTLYNRENYTLFGEALHLHSLDYTDIDWYNPHKGSPHVPLDSDTPNVVFFDAWDNVHEKWLDWDQVTALVDVLGFETARVLERGDPDDLSFEMPDESQFGGPPEGIVVRRVDGSARAKKVTDEFKEKNAVTFNDAAKAQSEAGEFCARFVTEARMAKIAHKLIDEGEYDALEMRMMEDLPRKVLQDIMQEEGWNLLRNEYGFSCEFDEDFKSSVRSKASQMCARQLRRELQDI